MKPEAGFASRRAGTAMRVSFFGSMRSIVGGRDVDVSLPDDATVRDLAVELVRRWPALREHLFTEAGAPSGRVAIYVDGRNVRWLPDSDATRLSENHSVALIPPTAGG